MTMIDSNFALIENENLQINITSDAYLRNYQCETSPPSDYVREFPLQGGYLCICFGHIVSVVMYEKTLNKLEN